MCASALTVAGVLLLLIPLASAQATQFAPDCSPKLHFVAQLSVSGCALFVHDTGANDGPHLAVEPIMCVTEDLRKVEPRYDPVTQMTYVSVPVMLRDDAMLAEVQRQLRHLSPKSVKFANVSDISVSTDASSKFQALGFDWTPEEPNGILRLGLGCGSDCGSNLLVYHMLRGLQNSQFEAIESVLLAASIACNNSIMTQNYRVVVQNQSFSDTSLARSLPECQKLRFAGSIRLSNYTARVHKRLDMKGEHFLIEPLLWHNITSMISELVKYDYSRDMYYLKLDVVLKDDMAVDAVRTQLADLSLRSVTFMELRRAQSHVASALSRRFVISPLMVSRDWRSAQLRVHCETKTACNSLRAAIAPNPTRFWRHIKWTTTSEIVDSKCQLKAASRIVAPGAQVQETDTPDFRQTWPVTCEGDLLKKTDLGLCSFTRDGRLFAVIQQRITGRVSFERYWPEYVSGFGDESDFWIGLSRIHSLSKNFATLRVEMKLWNGTELHAEYFGFKVGDTSTNYTMTYLRMLWDRSSVSSDMMASHNGTQFSTRDRDNDKYMSGSCSYHFGKGGWWYNDCYNFNPNGLFPSVYTSDDRYCSLDIDSGKISLREVRLMVQI